MTPLTLEPSSSDPRSGLLKTEISGPLDAFLGVWSLEGGSSPQARGIFALALERAPVRAGRVLFSYSSLTVSPSTPLAPACPSRAAGSPHAGSPLGLPVLLTLSSSVHADATTPVGPLALVARPRPETPAFLG